MGSSPRPPDERMGVVLVCIWQRFLSEAGMWVGTQPGGLLTTVKIDQQREGGRVLASDACWAGVTRKPTRQEKAQQSNSFSCQVLFTHPFTICNKF